jgi:hypothetical protein
LAILNTVRTTACAITALIRATAGSVRLLARGGSFSRGGLIQKGGCGTTTGSCRRLISTGTRGRATAA